MIRIAHFRRILKDDFFKSIEFFAEFLSARDIPDAADEFCYNTETYQH